MTGSQIKDNNNVTRRNKYDSEKLRVDVKHNVKPKILSLRFTHYVHYITIAEYSYTFLDIFNQYLLN